MAVLQGISICRKAGIQRNMKAVLKRMIVISFLAVGMALTALSITACGDDDKPHCGDGVVDEPIEQCDDGNTDNFDGCSNDCKTDS